MHFPSLSHLDSDGKAMQQIYEFMSQGFTPAATIRHRVSLFASATTDQILNNEALSSDALL